jgi:protein-disulfide isomerase
MKNSVKALLVLCLVSLGACSRQEPATPAPAAAAQPAPAAAPAPLPAAELAPVPLAPELLSRLERPHSPVLGSTKARVTLVEVLDPACGACRAYAPVVQQVLFAYPDDVRVVIRFADFHPPSEEAIRALQAARLQGKFAPLLDALFERQEEWASHSAPNPEVIWKIAAELGVNVAKAKKDATSANVDDLLRQEAEDLVALKVESTPSFFLDGKLLPPSNAVGFFDFVKKEVEAAK